MNTGAPAGSAPGGPGGAGGHGGQSGGPANSNYLLNDQKLQEILLSDVGVDSLLSRAKQSIFSAKEFAAFVKRLAQLEADHAMQLKKTARSLTDTFRRPEIKKGTFQSEVLELIKATDRVGDASNGYVEALQRINDELIELVKSIDRRRKAIKDSAQRNEKMLLEAEQLAEKAKQKYDSACDELDRVRNGDPSKKLGLGKKSEEELHKRMTIAEVDYQQKVDSVQRLRQETQTKHRVEHVRSLQGIILECDEALNLQVTRYANLTETLQLNRGFVISPIKPQNSPTANLSVKEMAGKIDSQLDFYNFVLAIPTQIKSLNRPEIKFRKHPTLGGSGAGAGGARGGAGSAGNGSSFSTVPNSGFGVVPQQQQQQQQQQYAPPPSAASAQQQQPPHQFGGPPGGFAPPQRDRLASNATASSTGSVPSTQSRSTVLGPGTAKTGPVLGPAPGAVSSGPAAPAGPREQPGTAGGAGAAAGGLGAGAAVGGGAAAAAAATSGGSAPAAPAFDPHQHGLPVFGTKLEELLDYEEGTVPRVVYQCIQAIDNFGLEVEGIYRTNGNNTQVQEIKRQFDIDAASVDLLRPSEEVNDIHSVASALKLYFRELPDPLLTKEFHREFMNAANIDDETRRRDAIHGIINKLPDPNYTTLRYLVFHLYRVQEREAINRMSIANLGIVWGPTLMATDYSNVGEMAVQGRVIETVLVNAYAIFEAE